MGWAKSGVVQEFGVMIWVVSGARFQGSNRLVAAANDIARAGSGSHEHLDSQRRCFAWTVTLHLHRSTAWEPACGHSWLKRLELQNTPA